MLIDRAPNGVPYNRLDFIDTASKFNNAATSFKVKGEDVEKRSGLWNQRLYKQEYTNAFTYPELLWEQRSRKPFDPYDTKYYNGLEYGAKTIRLGTGPMVPRSSIRGMPIIKA
eukprot:765645-Hanusia_phi.AAC.5